uniref:HEAT repeat domain-containing protein n=1 Tax=Roseihalotalea indica TaxID=2867963 RepID=A0AA49JJ47_9BACT|nr:HEAT repeat domain-containing protein [Tunicatimonas sp. TK19036]
MKEQHIVLIMDYLDGHWDAEKDARLQHLIASGEIDPAELSEWKQANHRSSELPTPVPSAQLRENFYTMLSQWDATPQQSWWQRMAQSLNTSIRLSQLVAGAMILTVGILLGFWLSPAQRYETQITHLSTEVQQMREAMVLTLLEQPSAMQRLKAVSISTDLPSTDAKIHHALLRTLNEDPQVNVRLAALEALIPYAQDSLVRQGLVQSIAHQDDPLLQIALAQTMVDLQEKQAVKGLEKLLERENLNQDAKQSIEKSLQVLI